MRKDTKRSIGALIGLVLGLTLMMSLGLGGLIYAFIFGAGGAVAGGMIGERWKSPNHDERRSSND
jgi:outer membrane lipoprotein SlyB